MRFISSLKSLLASEEEQHHTQDSNPHFITQPARIKHMLQLLMESHVQVSVVFDEQSDHTSMLLDISTNEITLDQLNSRAAHHKMQPGQIIQINAKHHSVPLNFSSTITAISKNGDYLCSMPEKIYHPQKRAFFRIPLENIEKYKFSGAIQFSENLVSGYLYDVSFGGISVAVYSNTYIKKGDILSPASIKLKNGSTIHSDFTVCSIRKSPLEGFSRIGCEFLNLQADDKRILHKFITESDRERAKK